MSLNLNSWLRALGWRAGRAVVELFRREQEERGLALVPSPTHPNSRAFIYSLIHNYEHNPGTRKVDEQK